MTPDLDQTLSLKAQLNDLVTPTLRKIEQNTRTTSDALNQLVQAFEQAGAQTGSSTKGMTDKVGDNLDQLQAKLKETGGGFREFGEEASQNSRKVGQALEDALYTEGATRKLDELDKDLGGVNRVFTSMASRQRSISGKARNLQAVTKDNINKRVIPAFEELHATLDDYPDTLKEINSLEEGRMKMLSEGGSVLSRVGERLKGLTGIPEKIKFGVADMAGVVTGGMLGVAGMKVQEQQREVARVGGVDAFQALPGELTKATMQAQTTMDVAGPFVLALKELNATSSELIPETVSQMVNLSKATGMSVEETVALQHAYTRLGGVKLPDYEEIMSGALSAAQESAATWDDMSATIQEASLHMLNYSEAQRKTFVNNQIAATAAAKDLGLQADAFETLRDNILDNSDAYARFAGMLASAGSAFAPDEALRDANTLIDAMQDIINTSGAKSLDMETFQGRQVYQQVFAPLGIGEDMFRRMVKGMPEGEGVLGQTAAERLAKVEAGAPTAVEETSKAIRGTVAEQYEQIQGTWDSGIITPGTKLIEGFGVVVDKFGNFLEQGVTAFQRFDESVGGKASTGVAAAGAAAGVYGAGQGLGALMGFKEGGIASTVIGLSALTGGAIVGTGGAVLTKDFWKDPLGNLFGGKTTPEGQSNLFGEKTTPEEQAKLAAVGLGPQAMPQEQAPLWAKEGIPEQKTSIWTKVKEAVHPKSALDDPEFFARIQATLAQQGVATTIPTDLSTAEKVDMASAIQDILDQTNISRDSFEGRKFEEAYFKPMGLSPDMFERARIHDETMTAPVNIAKKTLIGGLGDPLGTAWAGLKELHSVWKGQKDLEEIQKRQTMADTINALPQAIEVTAANIRETGVPTVWDGLGDGELMSQTLQMAPELTTTGEVEIPAMNEVARNTSQQTSILKSILDAIRNLNGPDTPQNPRIIPGMANVETPGVLRDYEYFAAELGR